MGAEYQLFLKNLPDKLSGKDKEPYTLLITWLRTRLSFEILSSVHMCITGDQEFPFTTPVSV